MKGVPYFATGLLVFLMTTSFALRSTRGAELDDVDRQFLARYEKVRAALAADDLSRAKRSAKELGEEGDSLGQSTSMKDARAAFSKLSEHAIALARGRAGYYVIRCPMLKEMWLQPAGTISNPYAGQSMPECGMIMK